MTEVRKETQRFNPHVFPCCSQHLNHVLLILCPPQTHHVHKTLKCFPCLYSLLIKVYNIAMASNMNLVQNRN